MGGTQEIQAKRTGKKETRRKSKDTSWLPDWRQLDKWQGDGTVDAVHDHMGWMATMANDLWCAACCGVAWFGVGLAVGSWQLAAHRLSQSGLGWLTKMNRELGQRP